jgi:hypothetical protein
LPIVSPLIQNQGASVGYFPPMPYDQSGLEMGAKDVGKDNRELHVESSAQIVSREDSVNSPVDIHVSGMLNCPTIHPSIETIDLVSPTDEPTEEAYDRESEVSSQ